MALLYHVSIKSSSNIYPLLHFIKYSKNENFGFSQYVRESLCLTNISSQKDYFSFKLFFGVFYTNIQIQNLYSMTFLIVQFVVNYLFYL